MHRPLREWLTKRHQLWPHTPNRHVLLSLATAAGTEPVSDYFLSWHLSMQNVALERLRADRIVHEALAVNADPLHLVAAFKVCMQTAVEHRHRAQTPRRPDRGHTSRSEPVGRQRLASSHAPRHETGFTTSPMRFVR
ncbi:hypothetical protein [Amycolatopsis taiwanensis]|uniref:Uncharacterized protein n=1 Tax=Amycolatopsis taiwanensis TaxID=342230 RepID=A0A9W6R903_9PSEU|nr:hypothetical protein [Amycolatopsis taiwanensis]GLY71113.1 hypothetical protein Atai01_77320 [Amycolatopsis taiwanensis]